MSGKIENEAKAYKAFRFVQTVQRSCGVVARFRVCTVWNWLFLSQNRQSVRLQYIDFKNTIKLSSNLVMEAGSGYIDPGSS